MLLWVDSDFAVAEDGSGGMMGAGWELAFMENGI